MSDISYLSLVVELSEEGEETMPRTAGRSKDADLADFSGYAIPIICEEAAHEVNATLSRERKTHLGLCNGGANSRDTISGTSDDGGGSGINLSAKSGTNIASTFSFFPSNVDISNDSNDTADLNLSPTGVLIKQQLHVESTTLPRTVTNSTRCHDHTLGKHQSFGSSLNVEPSYSTPSSTCVISPRFTAPQKVAAVGPNIPRSFSFLSSEERIKLARQANSAENLQQAESAQFKNISHVGGTGDEEEQTLSVSSMLAECNSEQELPVLEKRHTLN